MPGVTLASPHSLSVGQILENDLPESQRCNAVTSGMEPDWLLILRTDDLARAWEIGLSERRAQGLDAISR